VKNAKVIGIMIRPQIRHLDHHFTTLRASQVGWRSQIDRRLVGESYFTSG